jgi:hypothetical protein
MYAIVCSTLSYHKICGIIGLGLEGIMLTQFTQLVKRVLRVISATKSNPVTQYDDILAQLPSAWLQPPPDFDEQRYLAENQDVRGYVRQGRFASGFDHYMKHGRHEGRRRPIKHL